jgi:hypothetical protein
MDSIPAGTISIAMNILSGDQHKKCGRLFHAAKDIGFPHISERPLPKAETKKGPAETIDGAQEGVLLCEICEK